VKTDKASGIVNNATDCATKTMNTPRYPLELFLRVITVSHGNHEDRQGTACARYLTLYTTDPMAAERAAVVSGIEAGR
jgi:hypothetical protein